MVVGYNDTTNKFKFKISWGNSWGDNGYGYLPYYYFLSGNMFDLWSIYTIKDNLKTIGIEITNPAIKQQILQNELTDIFNYLITNINKVTTVDKRKEVFTFLLTKYNGNHKIATFLSKMNSSFPII